MPLSPEAEGIADQPLQFKTYNYIVFFNKIIVNISQILFINNSQQKPHPRTLLTRLSRECGSMFCSPCQLLFHREADISGALAHGLLVLVPAGLGLALDHPAPGRLGIAARRGTCSSPLASALARPFCAATAHRCLRTPPGSARSRRLPGRSQPQGCSIRARAQWPDRFCPCKIRLLHPRRPVLSLPLLRGNSPRPRRLPARLGRVSPSDQAVRIGVAGSALLLPRFFNRIFLLSIFSCQGSGPLLQ